MDKSTRCQSNVFITWSFVSELKISEAKSANVPRSKPLWCIFELKFIWQIHEKCLTLTSLTQHDSMILSFGSKDTKKIWLGERVKKLPLEIQQIGRRKLRMLNNSLEIADLMIPPSNKPEKLKGKSKDFYSIRINDQWRIVFRWENNNAFEVEIVDYH